MGLKRGGRDKFEGLGGGAGGWGEIEEDFYVRYFLALGALGGP